MECFEGIWKKKWQGLPSSTIYQHCRCADLILDTEWEVRIICPWLHRPPRLPRQVSLFPNPVSVLARPSIWARISTISPVVFRYIWDGIGASRRSSPSGHDKLGTSANRENVNRADMEF